MPVPEFRSATFVKDWITCLDLTVELKRDDLSESPTVAGRDWINEIHR